MIRIYEARDPADAHLVVGYLESHGIKAIVQGEDLWGAIGELPFVSSAPSVSVAESDALRARELVLNLPRNVNPTNCPNCGHMLRGLPLPRCPDCGEPFPRPVAPRWTCATCGEQLEEQFTACWNCGTDRPDSSQTSGNAD